MLLELVGSLDRDWVLVTLVPQGQPWSIGSLHLQQSSYRGRSAAEWREASQKASQPLLRFLYTDLAEKLLAPGPYHSFQAAGDRKAHQASAEAWTQAMAHRVQPEELAHVGSVLGAQGPSVQLRLRTPTELTPAQVRERCQQVAKRLQQDLPVATVRCGFLLPEEPPTEDGRHGSMRVRLL